MATYRDRGVVLRTWKLGEADRIVSILGEERGKIRAVAKGVRKPRSRFGGKVEPTRHVAVQCYEGRNLDTLTQVESIDGFRAIREDLDRFTKAAALLEVADHFALEDQPDPAAYRMLLGALRELDRADSPMLVPAFILKRLAHEGLAPELDVCVVTGATEDLVAFDVAQGGVVCGSVQRGRYLEPEALALMRAALGGSLREALAVPTSPATHTVADLAVKLYEHHAETRLRSVQVGL